MVKPRAILRASDRGFTLLEMALVASMLGMLMLIGVETLGHGRGGVGTSATEFIALMRSAQALAASTAGDPAAADGTSATRYSGATIIVTPDPTGPGSIATLYRYRPMSRLRGVVKDVKTPPLELLADVSGNSLGVESATFALYFSNSGHVSMSVDYRSSDPTATFSAEPACGSVTLGFHVGSQKQYYSLECENGAVRQMP